MRRLAPVLTVLVALLVTAPVLAGDFRAEQLRIPRVREAVTAKAPQVQAAFEAKGLPYPPKGVFIRVFKADRELELWGARADGTYALVRTYPICASSGGPGPKRREGDGQVPEGFYSISVFNPRSDYHLSLGIDYPNASDRVRGQKGDLGGAIMIHGHCVTIGCVPITDPMIEEVYIAGLEARAGGQARIEAHFFPARLDDSGWERLRRAPGVTPDLVAFWSELKPGFDAFERTHRPPAITVERDGRYTVKERVR